MNCLHPVKLKNGTVVSCGKCDLCLSSYRNDWSVRLQIHAGFYSKMPLFITLTYDDDHVVYADEPTLVRSDVSLFLKRYKEKYKLRNDHFSYFGCGEYGDKLHRPHYHLLFFGDDRLFELYQQSSRIAEKDLYDNWHNGFVDVGIADWSGIHYVTKYVLKQIDGVNCYDDVLPQFTLCSRGLGNKWFESKECALIKSRISYYIAHRIEILDEVNKELNLTGEYGNDIRSIKRAVDTFEKYVPQFNTVLPSGKIAPLPRYFRRKLIGSFEHFKDNPFWFYQYLRKLLAST